MLKSQYTKFNQDQYLDLNNTEPNNSQTINKKSTK
jgi:hypothetical protein